MVIKSIYVIRILIHLIFLVETEDFYQESNDDPTLCDTLDFSNYSQTHPIFKGLSEHGIKVLINKRKKRPACMKYETEGHPILSYVVPKHIRLHTMTMVN